MRASAPETVKYDLNPLLKHVLQSITRDPDACFSSSCRCDLVREEAKDQRGHDLQQAAAAAPHSPSSRAAQQATRGRDAAADWRLQ